MRISDWSSDVCSSDLERRRFRRPVRGGGLLGGAGQEEFMHRADKPITLKNAVFWSIFWVVVAMAFAGFLYAHHGAEVASLFVTGYALEKVLSVDNLFVMMAIFSWFAVPDRFRHRILYWGIIGAIVFRAIFVAIGTEIGRAHV